MTIRAILQNGHIQPLEPLPPDWDDGQELLVEEPARTPTAAEVDAWAKDLESAAAGLPAEEHERFRKALTQIELESKESTRREWGLK